MYCLFQSNTVHPIPFVSFFLHPLFQSEARQDSLYGWGTSEFRLVVIVEIPWPAWTAWKHWKAHGTWGTGTATILCRNGETGTTTCYNSQLSRSMFQSRRERWWSLSERQENQKVEWEYRENTKRILREYWKDMRILGESQQIQRRSTDYWICCDKHTERSED